MDFDIYSTRILEKSFRIQKNRSDFEHDIIFLEKNFQNFKFIPDKSICFPKRGCC